MISVAIDGPAGAGKSTISKRVAKQLGFMYVDTGALYRAVGYYALQNGADPADERQMADCLPRIQVELVYRDGEQRIILNAQDVSEAIRTPEMSTAASQVSALRPVRDFLFNLQQSMAERYDVVMDGRDIGTVVLPNANAKIFLTATPEDRARRRYEEYRSQGRDVPFEEILADMKQRDYNDSNREISPLRQAEDAILLDTTGNELEQSVALVIDTLKERGIG